MEPPRTSRSRRMPSAYVVADRNQRKVRAVDAACFRVHRAGARGAVTGAQHIDADHKVVIQREHRAGGEDLRPPGAHQRRAGQRMADQHGVVLGRVQPAIDGIMQRNAGQRAAALQQQGLVQHKVAFVGRRKKKLRGRRASRPGSCFTHDSYCATRTVLRALHAALSPLAACIAWSRSAIRSRISSMPTLSRTSSGVTPVSACSAGESCACVVEAG